MGETNFRKPVTLDSQEGGSERKLVTAGVIDPSENAISEILALHDSDFLIDPELKVALREVIENPSAVLVGLRDQMSKIVGFALGLPNPAVYKELVADDPDFENNPEKLYIYDMLIKKSDRGLENFLKLANLLVQEG